MRFINCFSIKLTTAKFVFGHKAVSFEPSCHLNLEPCCYVHCGISMNIERTVGKNDCQLDCFTHEKASKHSRVHEHRNVSVKLFRPERFRNMKLGKTLQFRNA